MSKLQLPNVTLLCVDCVDVDRAIAIVEHCKTMVDFGAVKVISNQERNYPIVKISPLNTLVMYSVWMLTECHKYIDTDYVLIVQGDGWILNPEQWDNDWLKYDYIGPVFDQEDRVGSGGFSFRSKLLMQATSLGFDSWDGTEETANAIQSKAGCYEDGVISYGFNYFNICPINVANLFAQGGNQNPANHNSKPFGFHRGGRIIDYSNGVVEPSIPDGTLGEQLLNKELVRLMNKYKF